jgi:hypothetical protein
VSLLPYDHVSHRNLLANQLVEIGGIGGAHRNLACCHQGQQPEQTPKKLPDQAEHLAVKLAQTQQFPEAKLAPQQQLPEHLRLAVHHVAGQQLKHLTAELAPQQQLPELLPQQC